MAAVIGNDILDIGSSKNRKQQQGFVAPSALTLGRPGQFDVPNVPDVRSLVSISYTRSFRRPVPLPIPSYSSLPFVV